MNRATGKDGKCVRVMRDNPIVPIAMVVLEMRAHESFARSAGWAARFAPYFS